jgi:UPF0716 protein FxsA
MRFFIVLLPWLELFSLIELGVKTSALTAIAYVLITLLVGWTILQRQGRGMLERLRQARGGGGIGPEFLRDDMAMGFAGLLLMIPGMITDVIAIVVMAGPLRRRLVNLLQDSSTENRWSARVARERKTDRDVIEGDFKRVVDEDKT